MYHVNNSSKVKFITYILVLFFLVGCDRGYKLTNLYYQKIKNSNKRIFLYQAWSTLNDGSKSGRTILDENEAVSIVEAEQMPWDFILESSKDTVYVIELKDGGTRIPKYISTEISKYQGLIIKSDYFTYELGTSHNLSYKFSSFRETYDSLFIFGIEEEFFDVPNNKKVISFRKGNIKLIEADSLKGIVKRIEIPAILSKNFSNTSIDKITIIPNDSFNINGLVYFQFEPLRQIKTSEFSDEGFFKKRGIIDKDMIR